jgi:hypothetical protein
MPRDDGRTEPMSRLEYWLAAALLRVLGWLFDRLPGRPRRIVLTSPRKAWIDGNLLQIERAIRRLRPNADVVVLAEPYSYGLRGKLAYALRIVRGMYHTRTAGLVVVDNAYLPVHVAPHPPRTTVVRYGMRREPQRFGFDATNPPHERSRPSRIVTTTGWLRAASDPGCRGHARFGRPSIESSRPAPR